MTKHLFVLSLDALGAKDLEDLSELPAIKSLIDRGVHVKEVSTIYPSLTYPAHTSIITGHYPLAHGIINNTKIQPEKSSPDWHWYKRDIQVPTLYDLAKAKGYKTAAFLWPVAAQSGIDYNIAEIFPNRFWLNQVMVSLWASSPFFLLDMNRKYGHLRDGIKQPNLDAFLVEAVTDTIRSKKPGLLLAHFVDMDSMRHEFGVESDEAKAALKRHDERVGKIIEATKEAGIYPDTTFAILGDHYQIDVHTAIRLNVRFLEEGYLEANQEQEIKRYHVYAKSCDGSSYIYVKDKTLKQPVYELLKSIPEIEHVYTSAEIINLGADPDADFMVEGKPGYYFIEDAAGPFLEKITDEKIGEPNFYKAVHGYHPDKSDYKTTLIFAGPEIKQGEMLDSARLIDEAPTFARILGFDMKNTEGEILHEIFKEKRE
ncbi:putative type I phosphodiesterase/nucleotide pyrophosphatase family protein [Listeria floridensis FSL S10-1187]|uniref:Type I phosphodiesterase/nucleotide pyrophosphatase family protein n=1 Tax=Listeria floridensis FSL S10-1187 TaxID=1265817 RepID=A0ABP3AZY9_9LIST|nr:ectonucleotide pyrophosphatase/phosphodiesterase [Listeria floridensis]EUJ33216.1 putative type I phosphodiesterase/nucleotide pyrophosphatase family protein [Listeria floridensis FSL S10-1187]